MTDRLTDRQTDRRTDGQTDRQTERGDLLDWVCGIEAAKSIVKVKVIVILKIRCVGFILIRMGVMGQCHRTDPRICQAGEPRCTSSMIAMRGF